MQLKVGLASTLLRFLHFHPHEASSIGTSSSSALIGNGIKREEERILSDARIDIREMFEEKEEDASRRLYSHSTDDLDLDDEEEEEDAPRRLYDEVEHIEYAHVYGNIHHLQYYFIDLMIGSPEPQRISVIADTGSDLCGFPCVPHCTSCGTHIDTQFDISKSKSARLFACAECGSFGSCNDKQQCTYSQSYSEGSSIRGLWFEDKISFGDVIDDNPTTSHVALGCHTVETNLFVSQKANGIIGLGPGRNNARKTVLEDLYQDKKHINHRIFTMCLSQDGGILSVGGFNKTMHSPKVAPWLHMDASSYYHVDMVGIYAAGATDGQDEEINKSTFSSVIVDSGTTFSYFPRNPFWAMINKIHDACNANSNCAIKDDDSNKCVTDDKGMPTFRFSMRKKSGQTRAYVNWEPSSYFFKKGNEFCFSADKQSMWSSDVILGASFMLNFDVIFDLEKLRIKFQKAVCPTFVKREFGPAPPKTSTTKPAETEGTTTKKPTTTEKLTTTEKPTTEKPTTEKPTTEKPTTTEKSTSTTKTTTTTTEEETTTKKPKKKRRKHTTTTTSSSAAPRAKSGTKEAHQGGEVSQTFLIFYGALLIIVFLGGISIGFSFYRRKRQFKLLKETDDIGTVPGEKEDDEFAVTFGDSRLFQIEDAEFEEEVPL